MGVFTASDGSPQGLISKNIKILISYIILMSTLNINILEIKQTQRNAARIRRLLGK